MASEKYTFTRQVKPLPLVPAKDLFDINLSINDNNIEMDIHITTSLVYVKSFKDRIESALKSNNSISNENEKNLVLFLENYFKTYKNKVLFDRVPKNTHIIFTFPKEKNRKATLVIKKITNNGNESNNSGNFEINNKVKDMLFNIYSEFKNNEGYNRLSKNSTTKKSFKNVTNKLRNKNN